ATAFTLRLAHPFAAGQVSSPADSGLDGLDCRARRPCRLYDAGFLLRKLSGRLSHGFDLVAGYDHRAVAVGLDQVAALDCHTVHLHVDAELDDVDESVRRPDRPGQHLEPRRDDGDVADGAARDDTEGAERLVHVRLHLTPERAIPRGIIEVLHDHH